MGITIELSGRARLPDAVPDADYNLAATGAARSLDTVRLNEQLDLRAAARVKVVVASVMQPTAVYPLLPSAC